MTKDEALTAAGLVIAEGLARQAARTPREAAVAAGARSELEVDCWIARHYPDLEKTA